MWVLGFRRLLHKRISEAELRTPRFAVSLDLDAEGRNTEGLKSKVNPKA